MVAGHLAHQIRIVYVPLHHLELSLTSLAGRGRPLSLHEQWTLMVVTLQFGLPLQGAACDASLDAEVVRMIPGAGHLFLNLF